ncbi:hypothetical protein KAR91_08585 [Candidatus Pacearchaeota archaeon]|nr:hypothetical protein [Candidatus Pacearchaeota archaeon]
MKAKTDTIEPTAAKERPQACKDCKLYKIVESLVKSMRTIDKRMTALEERKKDREKVIL